MNPNLSVIRQQFAQCVFNHKIQEVASDRNNFIIQRNKKMNVLFTFLVLVSVILQTSFPEQSIFSWFSIILTILQISFLIYQLSFNSEKLATLHKSSALEFLSIRERYKSLICDIVSNKITDDFLLSRRNELNDAYISASDQAPNTERGDFKEAQKRLGLNGEDEDYTWSDKEIDSFLPLELKTVE